MRSFNALTDEPWGVDVAPVVLRQVNLVVCDTATLAFYWRLGWTIETPTPDHAAVKLPNGIRVEFDSQGFTGIWDSSYDGATGGATVLGLTTETRQQVDDVYAVGGDRANPVRSPSVTGGDRTRYGHRTVLVDPTVAQHHVTARLRRMLRARQSVPHPGGQTADPGKVLGHAAAVGSGRSGTEAF